ALGRAPATGRQETSWPRPDASAEGRTPDASATDGSPAAAHAPEPPVEHLSHLRVVPAQHPGPMVLALLLCRAVLVVLSSSVTNPRWEWGVLAQWFFAESIIRGLLETLRLTAAAGAIGFGLGLVLALMRLSKSSLISGVSWTFSWVFRSTPLLVQLLLWYN